MRCSEAARASTMLALLAFAGCGGRGEAAEAAEALGTRLAGTWDVRFALLQSLVPGARPTDRVRGSIAFLANRRRDGPADYGTYDVDFRPFGFDTRDGGKPPTAIATWLAGDSVAIDLGSDGVASVAMRGRLSGDSVAGTWNVSLARAGGAGGRFVMRRR